MNHFRRIALTIACAATAALASVPGETLTPADPERYLIVGEDLAADESSQGIASRVLAVGVLVAAEKEPELAASMAIALASLAPDPEQFHGLWMLAISIDPVRSEAYRWLGGQLGPIEADAAETARILGQIRNNDPDGPRDITPAHRARIAAEADRLGLDHRRAQVVLNKWETDARGDPCKGRLFVRKRTGDRIAIDACPLPAFHHNDNQDEDWQLMVAIELSLLGADPHSWDARIGLGLDRPVPVWTLERLAEAFRVTPDRPVFRSGQWTER